MADSIGIGSGVTLLLGGARSGKSDLAVNLATQWDGDVTLAATATASDDDMAERILRHQAERPSNWALIEAPTLDANDVVTADPGSLLIIDCITLLVNNLVFAERSDEHVLDHLSVLAHALVSRPAPTLVISNEVGLGVVPATELGRRYRDLLGRCNRRLAEQSQTTLFVAAGRATTLLPVGWSN